MRYFDLRWKQGVEVLEGGSICFINWEFPKIGDPTVVPDIVGSLL